MPCQQSYPADHDFWKPRLIKLINVNGQRATWLLKPSKKPHENGRKVCFNGQTGQHERWLAMCPIHLCLDCGCEWIQAGLILLQEVMHTLYCIDLQYKIMCKLKHATQRQLWSLFASVCDCSFKTFLCVIDKVLWPQYAQTGYTCTHCFSTQGVWVCQ